MLFKIGGEVSVWYDDLHEGALGPSRWLRGRVVGFDRSGVLIEMAEGEPGKIWSISLEADEVVHIGHEF